MKASKNLNINVDDRSNIMRRFVAAAAAASGALLATTHCIKLPPAHEPKQEKQASMLDMWLVKTESARKQIMPRKDNHFFRVYTGKGEPTSLNAVLKEMKAAEVGQRNCTDLGVCIYTRNGLIT